MEYQTSAAMEEIKIIVLRLDSEEYGVDVSQVRSIERMHSITRVPSTPDFVEGVINLRGEVIPIINLRARMGIPVLDRTEETRIVIVGIGDTEMGLIVDSANDVIDISVKEIQAPPPVLANIEAKYIRGIAKLDDRLLILLDMEKVLNSKDTEIIKKIGSTNNGSD